MSKYVKTSRTESQNPTKVRSRSRWPTFQTTAVRQSENQGIEKMENKARKDL